MRLTVYNGNENNHSINLWFLQGIATEMKTTIMICMKLEISIKVTSWSRSMTLMAVLRQRWKLWWSSKQLNGLTRYSLYLVHCIPFAFYHFWSFTSNEPCFKQLLWLWFVWNTTSEWWPNLLCDVMCHFWETQNCKRWLIVWAEPAGIKPAFNLTVHPNKFLPGAQLGMW